MKHLHNRASDPFFCDELPEVRSIEDGGGLRVFGYWAVFNKESRVLSTPKGTKFREKILPGAFDNTDFSDVVSMFDHRDYLASEPNLRYGVDGHGAWYEYDHDPEDPTHVTALRRIQRREAKGSSFQFPPLPADCYDLSPMPDGVILRSVKRFPRIPEFGPVITPAYPSSTTFARSLDETIEQEELQTQQQHQQELEQQQTEARAVELLQSRQHKARVILAKRTL